MNKFAFDYNELNKKLNAPKAYRLSDVQDKIEKVAFDVVKFKSDDLAGLWKIEDTADGPVIVALYDENVTKTASINDWKTISDKEANIHVFYKGEPINKFAASAYGIDASSVGWIADKLKEDYKFRASFLKTLTASDRELLLKKYPELGREDK
jgi:hypothetical protein